MRANPPTFFLTVDLPRTPLPSGPKQNQKRMRSSNSPYVLPRQRERERERLSPLRLCSLLCSTRKKNRRERKGSLHLFPLHLLPAHHFKKTELRMKGNREIKTMLPSSKNSIAFWFQELSMCPSDNGFTPNNGAIV